jgi:hypothetical protein
VSGDGRPRLVAPPGVVTVLLRWRAELLVAGVVALAWRTAGAEVFAICALVLAVLVAFVPGVRLGAVWLVQALVVPHRVRTALVQAGVADRGGRMPWVVAARPIGHSVRVSIWLRAGTTVADVARAADLIACACGAVQVDVVRRFARADRVTVLVHRPRWGWPGH